MSESSPRSFVDSPRLTRWGLGDIVAVKSAWSTRKDHCGWVTKLPDPEKRKARVTVQFADGQKISYSPQNLRVPRKLDEARLSIEQNPHYIVFCNQYIIKKKKNEANVVDTGPTTQRRGEGISVNVPEEVFSEGGVRHGTGVDTPDGIGSSGYVSKRMEIMLETLVQQMEGLTVRLENMEERIRGLEEEAMSEN